MIKANIDFSIISKHRLELYHSKTTSECELKGPVQKVEQYVCKASFQSGCIVQGEMVVDMHIDEINDMHEAQAAGVDKVDTERVSVKT